MNKNEKKIIFFLPELLDGGAETLVKDYAICLKEKGHNVVILAYWTNTKTANYRKIVKEKIKIKYIYGKPSIINRIKRKFFRNIIEPMVIRNVIKNEKPDIIHAHLRVLSTMFISKKDLANTKLFYTCHNVPKIIFGNDKHEYSAAKELVSQNEMKIIALHNEMKSSLENFFDKRKIIVLHNGISLKDYEIDNSYRHIIRKKHNIPCDAFVIGHVGRFENQKNHDFLLKVFVEVSKRIENSFLLLIGDGTLKNKIEKELKDKGLYNRTLILSHRDDVNKLLKAMDVFVFPSRYEGFSIALLEAQAAGLRCIVSDTISPESFLSKQVVPMSLSSEISEWANVIIDSKKYSSYENRLKDYDINIITDKLINIYSE